MTCYVYPNFESKAALKKHISEGGKVRFEDQSFQGQRDYSNFSGKILDLCGPHFPQPHKWYANVVLEFGVVKKIL